MPEYVVVTPLRHGEGEEPTPPGKTVTLDEAEGDALIRLGALAKATGDVAGDGNSITPTTKPLAKMAKAELLAEAERIAATFTADMTNKELIAAIEAKQAEAGA